MKRRIREELLDELLAGYTNPEDLTGPEGLLKQLTGALAERAMSAELTDHLGHEPGGAATNGNTRHGTTLKTLTTDQGNVPIEAPRDRNGTFEPRLVKKHQRRFTGFDDKILSICARGMSVRDRRSRSCSRRPSYRPASCTWSAARRGSWRGSIARL